MTAIKLLHTYTTQYSADSIEWCPVANLSNFFVCGTYQLEEVAGDTGAVSSTYQKRKGQILLFSFDFATESYELKDQIEMDAVLDQKWHHEKPYLAAATSSGECAVFHLNDGKLNLLAKYRISEGMALALALDWNMAGDKLVVSNSKGGASILNFSGNSLSLECSWRAHGFEAWTCAFDRWNPNVVYTGGDDASYNAYDFRCSPGAPKLTWKNNSAHYAGVTSLVSFRTNEFLLGSGSYDERFQIYDTRVPKSSLSCVTLGGGVWRLRPNPRNESTILAACMYHNFSVCKLDASKTLSVVTTFDEHSSICYGCDWSQLNEGVQYFTTCSFYDRKMCICSVVEE